MERFVKIANKMLGIFGFKIIQSYIGFWSGDPPRRTTYPIGWRLARRAEYEGVPDGATELDYFRASLRREKRDRQ